jgi:hypothetical protein
MVTVIGAAVTPSAGTGADVASNSEVAADACGASKVTWAVAAIATVSVVSSALNVTPSSVPSLTENVADPSDPVTSELGDTIA